MSQAVYSSALIAAGQILGASTRGSRLWLGLLWPIFSALLRLHSTAYYGYSEAERPYRCASIGWRGEDWAPRSGWGPLVVCWYPKQGPWHEGTTPARFGRL